MFYFRLNKRITYGKFRIVYGVQDEHFPLLNSPPEYRDVYLFLKLNEKRIKILEKALFTAVACNEYC